VREPETTPGYRLAHFFSGPSERLDGLAAFARERGASGADEFDTLIDPVAHDFFTREARVRALAEVRARKWDGIFVGTPCTSFSCAHANAQEDGRVLGWRSWAHPSGAPSLPDRARRYLEAHDQLVEFTAQLLELALELDIDIIVENPAPRHSRELPSFWRERAHMPQLWDMPPMRRVLGREQGRLRLLL